MRVILITGVSSGFGRAMAKAFSTRGMRSTESAAGYPGRT